MEMYLEKELRLKRIGKEKDSDLCEYRFFNKEGFPTDYYIKQTENCFQILDKKEELLKESDLHKMNIHRKRLTPRQYDEVMCEYLKIDYEKFKYVIATNITKDELLHFMTNYNDGDYIQISIDKIFTPNSSYCWSDILKGFLNVLEDEIDDSYDEFLTVFLEYFIIGKDKKLNHFGVDELLYRMTSFMARLLTDEELKKFNFYCEEYSHFETVPFSKSFDSSDSKIDFEYIPIREDIKEDMTENEIEDREIISYEYKFVVTKKKEEKKQEHEFSSDAINIASSMLGGLASIYMMKKIISILRDK